MWLVAVAMMFSFQSGAAAPEEAFKIPDRWVVSAKNDQAAGEAGYRILHEDTGMELVWAPGGTFKMGGRNIGITMIKDEEPVHEVELDGFWMGRTEVTVAQWRSVMAEAPKLNDRGDDHPVVNVTWNQCREFLKKVGVPLRLPTEAQWAYAARGPQSLRYPWGEKWEEEKKHSFFRSVTSGSGDWTAPAGSFPTDKSWCGAMDMGGNAAEWCADWYKEDYYAESPRRNPTGPAEGDRRVVRGGTLHYSRYPYTQSMGGHVCRSAGRDWNYPDHTGGIYGFRISMSGP